MAYPDYGSITIRGARDVSLDIPKRRITVFTGVSGSGRSSLVFGTIAASLMTFPEHGMAVSVISNISYADTFSLAVKIAEAFARQGKSPASK